MKTPDSPPHASTLAALVRFMRHATPDALALVSMAAALGMSFSVELLADVSEETLAVATAAVSAALGAGLLHRIDGGEFAFRHEMVREVLSSELAPPTRRALEQRVAEKAASHETALAAPSPRNRRGRPLIGWEAVTGGEWRVVDVAMTGKTVREMAETLSLSPHTVETHLRRVYRKIGVGSRLELIVAVNAERPSGFP